MPGIGLGIGVGLNQNKVGETGVAPQFTANPVITATAFEVGQTLTCSDGTVTGTEPITYSYQWYRGVTAIGADQNTYDAVYADIGENITCKATPSNDYGSDVATSAAVVILATSNSSYYSDGINNYMTLGGQVNTAMEGDATFSIRMVRKLTDLSATQWILANYDGAGKLSYRIQWYQPNSKFRIWFSSDGDTWAGTIEVDGLVNNTNWKELIFTYNNGVITTYINSNPIGYTIVTGAIPATLFATGSPVKIGQNGLGTAFGKGYDNQIQVTSDVITSGEATVLYNGGVPLIGGGSLDNVVADYLFDYDTFDGTNWTLIDQKGLGNGRTYNMTAIDHDNNENPY